MQKEVTVYVLSRWESPLTYKWFEATLYNVPDDIFNELKARTEVPSILADLIFAGIAREENSVSCNEIEFLSLFVGDIPKYPKTKREKEKMFLSTEFIKEVTERVFCEIEIFDYDVYLSLSKPLGY